MFRFQRNPHAKSLTHQTRARRSKVRLWLSGLEDRCVPSTIPGQLDSVPLSFERNVGQSDARVQFLARGPGYGLFLTGSEAVLNLRHTSADRTAMGPQRRSDSAVLRMDIVGANSASVVTGVDQLPGTVNYFLGNNPAQWQANVPTFGRVSYNSVYPGIDLVYYGNQRQLEYDFVVAPGADPSAIRLAFIGADQVNVDANGNLVLHSAGGDVVQHAPVLYQQTAQGRQAVAGAFQVAGNQVTFRVGEYDTARPLVIDPVLSYSSYLGGVGYDAGTAIAVDSAGSVYVTGQTGTADFPTTPGAFRTTLGDTNNAAFVTKFNPAGTALIYSTYLGGGTFSQTVGYGIAVDAAGNAYVTGETLSANFPTTSGAFQSTNIGGYDAFVTKLNPQGNGLVYSIRLGGDFDDFGRGIAVDNAGRAVVTGVVTNHAPSGPHFPTANAFQPTYGGGNNDAFVTKFTTDGSALVFSTYLGGGAILNTTDDWGQAVATDGAGNTYVTGHTYSQDFPTTPGAFTRPGNDGLDAFVTKFAPTGAVVYSTRDLGGSGHEEAYGIAVDAAGNAYITGNTDSWDDPSTTLDTGFPTTPGAYRTTLVGQIDAFVAKLNAVGSDLVYGTYLGGSGSTSGGVDRGWGIAVDADGSAYVTGDTDSANFPVVAAIQPTKNFDKDAFVTKLNPAGSALTYSTFLGGELTDMARGIALDAAGSAYITGSTGSFQFPTTAGAFRTANAGGLSDHTDAFVAKIAAPVAPRVVSTQVNDGSAQRSRVTSLQVTFSAQVTFAGAVQNAFTLTRTGGGSVSFQASASVIGGVTVVTLNNFTGTETDGFGSLNDGRYTLTALAAQISANGQQMASNYTFNDTQGLYRLFGDVNGDRTVNGFDLGFFRNAFGTQTGDPNYLSYLDINDDGVINGFDLGQFRTRFGTVLP
jgi:beta-propeller repeat-containing protein/dockerin type I repeat protein